MQIYGYHRTSTKEQHLDRGIQEIERYCNEHEMALTNIFTDQETGKNFNRPRYTVLVEDVLRPGDILIVTELDRLGRNKYDTMQQIQRIKNMGVRLMVLELPTTLMDLSVMDNAMARMMLETINNMMLELYASMAQAELEKIIEELDAGMRRQFQEKFGEIRAEFDKVFKELFGGGRGTLELMETDILESGIQIIAQPPGKKLQNMMQLSGGEKALTAISLLFAIQNLKPSPFCLLDEIEAALDDSNVDRFAGYLHKLIKNTQFIVITHRRGTMVSADRLYGITMQEKGVSTLVSVNLIEDSLDK